MNGAKRIRAARGEPSTCFRGMGLVEEIQPVLLCSLGEFGTCETTKHHENRVLEKPDRRDNNNLRHGNYDPPRSWSIS